MGCFIANTSQHSNPHSLDSLHHNTDVLPLHDCGGRATNINYAINTNSIMKTVFLKHKTNIVSYAVKTVEINFIYIVQTREIYYENEFLTTLLIVIF